MLRIFAILAAPTSAQLLGFDYAGHYFVDRINRRRSNTHTIGACGLDLLVDRWTYSETAAVDCAGDEGTFERNCRLLSQLLNGLRVGKNFMLAIVTNLHLLLLLDAILGEVGEKIRLSIAGQVVLLLHFNVHESGGRGPRLNVATTVRFDLLP